MFKKKRMIGIVELVKVCFKNWLIIVSRIGQHIFISWYFFWINRFSESFRISFKILVFFQSDLGWFSELISTLMFLDYFWIYQFSESISFFLFLQIFFESITILVFLLFFWIDESSFLEYISIFIFFDIFFWIDQFSELVSSFVLIAKFFTVFFINI